MIDLKDKVVMVAGANGGIGSHVAEVLIECGATTALSFHNNSARLEEGRTKLSAAGVDGDALLVESAPAQALVDVAQQRDGRMKFRQNPSILTTRDRFH